MPEREPAEPQPARQLVTTSDDSLYELADYQRFLNNLGYHRLNDRAFAKLIVSVEDL